MAVCNFLATEKNHRFPRLKDGRRLASRHSCSKAAHNAENLHKGRSSGRPGKKSGKKSRIEGKTSGQGKPERHAPGDSL